MRFSIDGKAHFTVDDDCTGYSEYNGARVSHDGLSTIHEKRLQVHDWGRVPVRVLR